MRFQRIAFVASDASDAIDARNKLAEHYGNAPTDDADVIVALGGDGLMLQTLHRNMDRQVPIYGMNRGTVGFLMNDYSENSLRERLEAAELAEIHPLRMETRTIRDETFQALAINEVSLLRETRQAAKLRISIDGKVRLEQLICDGALVSTPAGSTAYNLSAHGPILPIDSNLLALTPISAFRPRRWRGALLPHKAHVRFDILEPRKRPVSAVADQFEVREVVSVEVQESREHTLLMLFDPGQSLSERIISEQFLP